LRAALPRLLRDFEHFIWNTLSGTVLGMMDRTTALESLLSPWAIQGGRPPSSSLMACRLWQAQQ
jgi:hypothetical protein